MSRKGILGLGTVILCAACGLAIGRARAQATPLGENRAEEQFKNIQVLRGLRPRSEPSPVGWKRDAA
jgi:hypothetical protein